MFLKGAFRRKIVLERVPLERDATRMNRHRARGISGSGLGGDPLFDRSRQDLERLRMLQVGDRDRRVAVDRMAA